MKIKNIKKIVSLVIIVTTCSSFLLIGCKKTEDTNDRNDIEMQDSNEEKQPEKDAKTEIMERVDGFWKTDDTAKVINRINFEELKRVLCVPWTGETHIGDIVNVDYDEVQENLTLDVEFFDYEINSNIQVKETFKFTDINTIEYTNNSWGTYNLNKLDYKDVIYLKYGQGLIFSRNSLGAGKSIREVYLNGKLGEYIVDKNKSKEDFDVNEYLHKFSSFGSPEELTFEEVDVFNNIKAYEIIHKETGRREPEPALIFEGGVTPEECKEMVYKFIN